MPEFTAINQANISHKQAMIKIERNQFIRYYNMLLSTGNKQLLEQFSIKHEENALLNERIKFLVLRYHVTKFTRQQYLDWIKTALNKNDEILEKLIVLEVAINVALDFKLFMLSKLLLQRVKNKDKEKLSIRILRKQYYKEINKINKFNV